MVLSSGVPNLLFGLFGLFLSKPSKVGKSYKLCLSGPTTVNTSHAENQTATKDKDNDIYTNRNTKTQTKKKTNT